MGEPSRDFDSDELGERVVMGLRRENYGLLRQRLDAINARRYRDHGWRIEYDPETKMAARMYWRGCYGADV